MSRASRSSSRPRVVAGRSTRSARQQSAEAEVELLLRTSLLREAGVPDETLVQLLTPIGFDTVDTGGQPVTEAAVAAGFFLPYIFTLIFVLSIFITSGYLLQSVTEEKENRVVEIVLSSIPALPLMAGKVLGLGAAGLTQVAVWLAAALLAMPLLNQQFAVDLSISLRDRGAGRRLLLPRLPDLRRDLCGDRRPGARRSRGAAVLELLRLLRGHSADCDADLPERPELARRLGAGALPADRTGGRARAARRAGRAGGADRACR